jgi:hypothetical protein
MMRWLKSLGKNRASGCMSTMKKRSVTGKRETSILSHCVVKHGGTSLGIPLHLFLFRSTFPPPVGWDNKANCQVSLPQELFSFSVAKYT